MKAIEDVKGPEIRLGSWAPDGGSTQWTPDWAQGTQQPMMQWWQDPMLTAPPQAAWYAGAHPQYAGQGYWNPGPTEEWNDPMGASITQEEINFHPSYWAQDSAGENGAWFQELPVLWQDWYSGAYWSQETLSLIHI